MKKVLVFDVNETLLDISALDPLFEQHFGRRDLRKVWFQQVIHNAFTYTIIGSYVPFGQIAGAALEMVALANKVALTDKAKQEILQAIKSLPPHADVTMSLAKLQTAGFQMVTLTNSTLAVVEEQLKNSGLTSYFERNFSGDTVRALKPARQAYEHVAKELNVSSAELTLVAAHAWDIAGAQVANYKTIFIARPGMVLNPLTPKVDIIGNNLTEIVESLITGKDYEK